MSAGHGFGAGAPVVSVESMLEVLRPVKRREILALLRHGPMAGKSIVARLNYAKSDVSKQLGDLRGVGLVCDRRVKLERLQALTACISVTLVEHELTIEIHRPASLDLRLAYPVSAFTRDRIL